MGVGLNFGRESESDWMNSWKVLAIISSSLSESVLPILVGKTTAREA